MKTHGASPATGRRRSATHSAARVLPLVGAAGILVPITLDVDPIHDIDLFVFEGAWVVLGVALLLPSTGLRPLPLRSDGEDTGVRLTLI
jgi:hypothetical protein